MLSLIIILSFFGSASAEENEKVNNTVTVYESVEQLSGKRIGVQTGTVFGDIAKEKIPDCSIEYFNQNTDLVIALNADKIDAYVLDLPVAKLIIGSHPNQRILSTLADDRYGYMFNKSNKGVLCGQMSEFLKKMNSEGVLNEISDVWFGNDETQKNVKIDDLVAKNGVLKLAVCCEIGEPFIYIKNGSFAGYDVDVAVRFCREYGYGIQIDDYSFSGMLSAVASGKADFAGSCISITDERRESYDFSEPNYIGGSVAVVKDSNSYTHTPDELKGKVIGVVTGSRFDTVAREQIPECRVEYYNSNSDLVAALESKKIDAYIADQPIARLLVKQMPDQYIYALLERASYGFMFPKENKNLCKKFDSYLNEIKTDGTLKEIDEKWFGDDDSKKVVDTSDLTAENGVLELAIATDVGAPFSYVKNGKFVGYDVDVAVSFCREYGYGINITNYNLAGLLAAITTGKCDFGASCAEITAERKQSMDFSNPDYEGGVVIVAASESDNQGGWFSSVRDSFNKTFIRESRWKLFTKGISVTVIITLLSVIFGTGFGFLAYMIYRKNIKPVNIIFNILYDIIGKTPVVVILMILYYIIFGKSNLSAMWVSVIGFTLIFTSNVHSQLDVGVAAVDGGQMEASLALGYTETKAFIQIILPQAMKYSIPGYKNDIVSLLKGTAVVGYVAVQDLTKVSDIVRSSTYEAFFPLISSAIIYFAIAWLLTLFVKRIEISIEPKRRKKEKILKGVKTK